MTTTIATASTTIIKRYGDFEVVAAQHANGYVGIYVEDGADLMQLSDKLIRPAPGQSAIEVADAMVAA